MVKFRPARFLAAVWLLMGVCLSAALGQTSDDKLFPPKPEPAVYVHDYSGWLSTQDADRLEQKLRRYFDSTSTQVVVMIRPDLGDYDKATYAIELGNRWGIGRKSKDNGVVMLIKSEPPDRGVFIATGYGTEGALPDILAGQIIRNTMAPFFRDKRYYEGIDAGTTAIIQALSGEFVNEGEPAQGGEIAVVVFVFVILLLIVMFAIFRARRGSLLTHAGPRSQRSGLPGGWWWWGGPWGGGGGGGGWGSGSGGGDWGGGGSFGGGSFGGGGAGGDW